MGRSRDEARNWDAISCFARVRPVASQNESKCLLLTSRRRVFKSQTDTGVTALNVASFRSRSIQIRGGKLSPPLISIGHSALKLMLVKPSAQIQFYGRDLRSYNSSCTFFSLNSYPSPAATGEGFFVATFDSTSSAIVNSLSLPFICQARSATTDLGHSASRLALDAVSSAISSLVATKGPFRSERDPGFHSIRNIFGVEKIHASKI